MKLKPTYETETFINERGYYVIAQIDAIGGDRQLIELSPDQMRILAADMTEHIEQSESWWPESDKGE